MNKTGAKGAYNQAAGEVKRQVGKAFDNTSLEAEGNVQKGTGKVQSGIGNIKDAVK